MVRRCTPPSPARPWVSEPSSSTSQVSPSSPTPPSTASVRCSGMRLYDYPASANCYKPRLLLALLGRDYERVTVDIFAGDTLTDAFAALNPARETPVLELDDGTIVTQSSAILWLLAEGTPYL